MLKTRKFKGIRKDGNLRALLKKFFLIIEERFLCAFLAHGDKEGREFTSPFKKIFFDN